MSIPLTKMSIIGGNVTSFNNPKFRYKKMDNTIKENPKLDTAVVSALR